MRTAYNNELYAKELSKSCSRCNRCYENCLLAKMAALDVCSQVVTVKLARIKKYAKLLLVNNQYDVGYALGCQ
jgi:hypothetical protein